MCPRLFVEIVAGSDLLNKRRGGANPEMRLNAREERSERTPRERAGISPIARDR
jgi:hypothetical protein